MTDVVAGRRGIDPSTVTDMAKYELSQVPLAKRCCWRAEAATVLRFAARVHRPSGPVVVEAELATAPAARRLQEGISKGFGYPASFRMLPGSTPHSGYRYLVHVTQDAGALAQQAGLIDSHGHLVRGLPRHVVTAICTAACDGEAAWRSAFITGGILTERAGKPAIELTCPDTIAAVALESAARRLGVHAKARDTRGTDRVLIKGGNACAALLIRLGAHEAVKAWDEDTHTLSKVASKGTAGNLGDANQSRSARAAATAAAQAERALDILGADAPPQLAAAGRLRIAHPQANLPELGQLADPPLSKDALAGRIRRLLAMADHRAAALAIPGTRAARVAAAPCKDHR